jgi:predicted dienelactone hydrolase
VRLSSFILGAAYGFAATLAQAAGLQLIEVPSEAEGPMSGAVWYPCAAPAQELTLHGVALTGVMDCPLDGNKFPLVVISHGLAGWFLGHHDTATALADAGFVVAAINHPGDNAFDKSHTDDISIAIERPRQITRLVDFMLGAWSEASKVDRDRIGIFGFSRGGYTGLATIGGNLNFRRAVAACAEQPSLDFCELFKRGETPHRTPTLDQRIKAAVLADPAFTFLFGADDLKDVTVPVQLWSSRYGGAGVTLESVAIVDRKLQYKSDFHFVPNAAHWAFLAPCSAELAKASPRNCVDAPDFDRVAFHQQFNAAVVGFFRQHLVGIGTP